MKRVFVFSLWLWLSVASAVAQEKPRIAVFSLEFATVKSEADAAFGTSIDVGKGAADIMVDALVRSEKVDVYEREQLEKIITEQDLTNSARFDPATAAKIGRNVGVQVVVIGSITKFGQHERTLPLYKSAEGVMEITARVVDTSTGRILYTVKGSGEETRRDVSLGKLPPLLPGSMSSRRLIGQATAVPTSAWLDKQFTESLIGAVMVEAAQQAATDIVGQLNKIPAATTTVAVGSSVPVPTPPAGTIAPLTEQVVVDMIKNQVPESDVIEIIEAHQNFAISPLEPSWAIAVAANKVPVGIQNAVRARANLPPVQASTPTRPRD